MGDEVKFSKEQMNAIENMLKKDIVPLINTEIKNNYIPRLLVEEILEECKKQKEDNKDCARDIFYQGCMYTCEIILKKENDNG